MLRNVRPSPERNSAGGVCRIVLLLLLLGACFVASASATIDFREIARQARLAAAAYRSEAELGELIAADNFELTLYHDINDLRMSFYLATDDTRGLQVIAVRGTTNVENAMIDIAFRLLPDDKTGTRLHEGFAFAARRIYRLLEPRLKKDYRLQSTGHSLGGAVAQILAMYLDADGYEVGPVITFGQPKVTNLAGANRYGHLDVVRVVTPADMVPLVPPFDPIDLGNIDIYWHTGREIVLLEGNRYALLEGLDSMLRAASFTQQPPTEENLRNHFMETYLDSIAAKLKSPERVELRNNLNLFNLFGNGGGG